MELKIDPAPATPYELYAALIRAAFLLRKEGMGALDIRLADLLDRIAKQVETQAK